MEDESSPAALVLEHASVREAIGDATARLNSAGTAQEIADAVGEVVRATVGWFGVALGLTDPVEPVLQQYWCAPLRDSVSARYLRVPASLDTPQTRAIRTGSVVFVPDVATLQAEFPVPFREVQDEGLGPCIALPLTSHGGRVLGALAFMWTSDVAFGPLEMELADALAKVTSDAVDRVHASARERSLAVALQTAFLRLNVNSEHVVIDARYRSADSALQIGGDWYDAIERRDGRVFVTVGDTVGSGLAAAAAMGRLRSSSGVTALQTTDPARVLQYLDDYAAHVPGATMATVAIAVYEPTRRRVRYVSAGHPPPVLVRPTGSVEVLWGGRSWPLDVDLGEARPRPASTAFPPGSTLVLYTDGLIERRDEVLHEGIDRLADSLRAHWHLPIPLLLERVLDTVLGGVGGTRDDVALIALRSVGQSQVHFVDVVSATREQLPEARHRVQTWLAHAGIDTIRNDVVLAVNEAIANAAEHGSDFDPAKLVTIEACTAEGRLVVSVSDSGRWRPGAEEDPPDRGRGFVLIEHLCDDVRIDRGPLGSTVTLTWELARRR